MFSKPMDLAVEIWRCSNSPENRRKFENLAEIGRTFHKAEANRLLQLCQSSDPADIYDEIEASMPSAYVIAELVLMAKESRSREMGRSGAAVRHAETNLMKAEVFLWLDVHMADFRSMDAAAQAITKLQPIVFRTARTWVGEWKKLQPAGRP